MNINSNSNDLRDEPAAQPKARPVKQRDNIEDDITNVPLKYPKSMEVVSELLQDNKVTISAGEELAIKLQEGVDRDDTRFRKEQEEARALKFENDGPLAEYLRSAKPKDLAAALDRNMKLSHIAIDKKLDENPEVIKHFSKEIAQKMRDVGVALEERIRQRSTFSGKMMQKVGDYAAVAANAFKKLFGKKVDDPKLANACAECHTKMEVIKEKSPHAASVGDFASKVLDAKLDKSHSNTKSRN